CAQAIAFPFTF
nr:immunoglobulin light chain junction region [Macaca mulatta]MOW40385.1 immunoglobulin light chain junction region [Macaca mulatta]MOW40406.1 immunoglobulin light chain junction region [Macaca mulatta]